MKIIDTELLKKIMQKRNITIKELSERINIDPSTFYRKISNGGETFTIGEMHSIAEALRLSNRDACRIFLLLNSQKRENDNK